MVEVIGGYLLVLDHKHKIKPHIVWLTNDEQRSAGILINRMPIVGSFVAAGT